MQLHLWTGTGTKITKFDVQTGDRILGERVKIALIETDLGPKPLDLVQPLFLQLPSITSGAIGLKVK